MDELSLKFNQMLMQEVGLEVGARQRLYDQDTGALVQIEGKDLVAPGSSGGREAEEFDPYNSTRMMTQIFGYYTNKLVENGEAPDFTVIYNVDCGGGKGRVELKNDENVIKSNEYKRDQCKYADIILQLNGDSSPDLKEFDIPKLKANVKNRTTKRERGVR